MSRLNIRANERGQLTELFKGKFAQANLLIMKKGSVWGKHYHKKTTEYFYLLEGELSLLFNYLKERKKQEMIFKTGESFIIKPYTFHVVYIRKTSRCLVLYSQQFSQEQPDIFYPEFPKLKS